MPHRILIVEDNAALREMFREMLSHHGLDVSVAATCAGACALAVDEVFDAVLVDVDLPDGSGIELCRTLEVRCSAFGRHLLWWLMTGSYDPDLTRAAIATGACGVFHKPFSVQAACTAIERLLGSGERSATAAYETAGCGR